MSEWDNCCGKTGEACKNMEAQAVRIAEMEQQNRELLIKLKEVRIHERRESLTGTVIAVVKPLYDYDCD